MLFGDWKIINSNPEIFTPIFLLNYLWDLFRLFQYKLLLVQVCSRINTIEILIFKKTNALIRIDLMIFAKIFHL